MPAGTRYGPGSASSALRTFACAGSRRFIRANRPEVSRVIIACPDGRPSLTEPVLRVLAAQLRVVQDADGPRLRLPELAEEDGQRLPDQVGLGPAGPARGVGQPSLQLSGQVKGGLLHHHAMGDCHTPYVAPINSFGVRRSGSQKVHRSFTAKSQLVGRDLGVTGKGPEGDVGGGHG